MSDQSAGTAVQQVEPIGNLVPDVGGGHGLPPSLQILLNEGLYNRIKQLSGVMARARGMTPGHLIDKPEACFAIINMSLDWKLSPHFVARHTYQTPGGQIGFDGALVQAVLEQSGRFAGSPRYEYRGNWESLTGKFDVKTGARGGTYPAPTWTSQDATGLGVIVRWQVKGERTPRVWPGEDTPFWLTQCFPLNSPLWATDPKTQIQYLAIRRFANLTSPGILGAAAFDQDELLDASERAIDVTEPRREDFATEAEPADERPEFVVTDNDGELYTYRVADRAAEGIAGVLREAARGGLERLTAAWENNQATVEQLAYEGCEGAAQIAQQYEEHRRQLTSPSRSAPGTAAEHPGPDATVEQSSQPVVAGSDADDPGVAAGAAHQGERPSLAITPPLRGGKPDYRTWALALMKPKILQQQTVTDLADLLGDNEEHLQQAERQLAGQHAPIWVELQAAIEAQWKVVK